MKPRVFVSSVIENFQDFREAARSGILKTGAEPILVNEDFPSLNVSPRNACLDGVDSSDFFILVIGSRGGWKTPSGKLVVEEELFRAKERKIPILFFFQETDRDSDRAIA